MKYSMYIGRVGTLAVALGIGAAVATSPGIAFAQESDSSPAPAGAEAPPNQPETPSPGVDGSDGEDGADGEDGGSNPPTAPPDMNVDGQTVDTGTHDDETGASGEEEADGDADEEEDGADIEDSSGDDQENPPAGNGAQAPAGGSGNSESQQNNLSAEQGQFTSNTDDGGGDPSFAGALRTTGGGADDDGVTRSSFKTSALDNSFSGASTFSSLTVDATEQVAQDPISALITLPFRFVSDVLTAVLGGPNTPPGENPLFLGLLAFVRRQFSGFERTFSNQAPVITGAQVDENEDGTFTITVDTEAPDVDASDPDGDELTFSATDGAEGTVEKTGVNTFTYTPGEDFDGDDTITLTVSDPGGLFGFNRKTDSVVVNIEAADEDPTEPDVTQPPTQQPDGSFEAELQFDPEKVTDVTIAEGFEPKYWTVEEVYNEETGKLELKLTPTQAGMLRAALGLDTTDSVGLEVTTTEQTIQTFSLRSASFAALAAGPDYTLELPDLPAGHFEVRDPILASPGEAQPETLYPAGVVVTDRYAYVVTSRIFNAGGVTVTVIGADPEEGDYLQVVDEIPVGSSALLAGLAGDRLYIANASGQLSVIDTDGADPAVDTDDNVLLDPINVGQPGGVIPIISPDEKTIYLINQQFGRVDVIDVDPAPAHAATYHTIVDFFDVADDPTVVDNGDGTNTVSGQFPLSGAFNTDGTRFYLVRDTQTYTQNQTTFQISDFKFTGEVLTIDTTSNDAIGTPLSLGVKYGYFASSDGKYLYVPTLDMNGFDPSSDTDIAPIIGSVTIVDVQDPDNPTIVADLPTGNLPVNVAFSPDKSLAYVVDAGEGTIWVIDTVNQEVLDLDPAAAGVQGLVFDTDPSAQLGKVFNVIAASPDGTRLFVSNFGKGTVTALEFVLD